MATVMITGANRGIGFELTKRYAQAGNDVIACCREPKKAGELNALDHVQVCGVHVSNGDSVAALKAEIGDRAIDLLINNAGAPGPAPPQQSALEMDYDGWAEAFAVNTMAPFRMLQTFRENLKAAEVAKVITITSQMGALDLNWPLMYAYCSSKAAVNKIMRMVSLELAADGTVVALIHPGHVKTEMGGASAEIEVEESAAGIMSVIEGLSLEGTGCFMKWNGEVHPW
jgi:NAD(P)-dependent dehydrogenase (short-subunit alcohol dehydrogenase family)